MSQTDIKRRRKNSSPEHKYNIQLCSHVQL